MNLLKLPQVYREALATHEALRRLGIESDRIFVAVSAKREVLILVSDADLRASIPEASDRDKSVSCAQKSLQVRVGFAPSDFEAIWPEACRAWNEAPEQELREVWEKSAARRNAPGLIVALDLARASGALPRRNYRPN